MEVNKNEIEEIREEMKDRTTNLENKENIVGRNMMENNMEDRMKIIEDRMENKIKKFEKIINAATTATYKYRGFRHHLRP